MKSLKKDNGVMAAEKMVDLLMSISYESIAIDLNLGICVFKLNDQLLFTLNNKNNNFIMRPELKEELTFNKVTTMLENGEIQERNYEIMTANIVKKILLTFFNSKTNWLKSIMENDELVKKFLIRTLSRDRNVILYLPSKSNKEITIDGLHCSYYFRDYIVKDMDLKIIVDEFGDFNIEVSMHYRTDVIPRNTLEPILFEELLNIDNYNKNLKLLMLNEKIRFSSIESFMESLKLERIPFATEDNKFAINIIKILKEGNNR